MNGIKVRDFIDLFTGRIQLVYVKEIADYHDIVEEDLFCGPANKTPEKYKEWKIIEISDTSWLTYGIVAISIEK